MTTNKETNIERILKDLAIENEVKKYKSLNKGWNTLSKERLKEILGKIRDYKKWEALSKKDGFNQRDKIKTNISLGKVRNPKNNEQYRFGRPEEAIERLICSFNKDTYFNQFRLYKSRTKEFVDLVCPSYEKANTFIELKAWKSADSPLFGVIELLKNYYIYKDRNNIKKLIFLAPSEYFESYKDKMDIFLEFVKLLNNDLKEKEEVEIKIQHFDLEKKAFDKCVSELGKTIESKFKESKSDRFSDIAVVDFKEEGYLKFFESIRPALKSPEFKDYKDN